MMTRLAPRRTRESAFTRLFVLAVAGLCIIIANGCSEAGKEGPPQGGSGGTLQNAPPLTPPAELASGEQKYLTFCAGCHGVQGRGTDHGPPLVHKIYEPSHHSDMAFQRAAARGVRAHHWHFGDMPPIAGVTSQDVQEITAYIRWLQRQAGIR
ncbi:cytochrome c [Candidatus Parcubacteria bacterium]|nr:MAG: cytochrome c [Candidatus Parcubacteria bacterium]